ncbi:MAG TPA: hypothetical protein VGH52_11595 [Gaiellaceae bacterium]
MSVVVLAAIGIGGYYAATSGGNAPKHDALPNPTMNLGISYGWTPQQVVHQIGQPTSKKGSCWIYDSPTRHVAGIYAGSYTDKVRFCFLAGVVSDEKDHEIAYTWHNVRHPAQWIVPLTFRPSYETIPGLKF